MKTRGVGAGRAIVCAALVLWVAIASPAKAEPSAPVSAPPRSDPAEEVLQSAQVRVQDLVVRRDALPEGPERAALDAEIVRVKTEAQVAMLRERLAAAPDDQLAARLLARLLDPAATAPASASAEVTEKPVPGKR